jgi:hypothetical protein
VIWPRRNSTKVALDVDTLAVCSSALVSSPTLSSPVALEQGNEVRQERLQALRADVTGRLPQHLQRRPGLQPISGSCAGAGHRSRAAACDRKHANTVLVLIARGQAEGVENLTPVLLALPPGSSPAVRPQPPAGISLIRIRSTPTEPSAAARSV